MERNTFAGTNEHTIHSDLSDNPPEPTINKEMLEMFLSLKEEGLITENAFYYLLDHPERVRTEGWREVLTEYLESKEKQEDPAAQDDFRDLIADELSDIYKETEDTVATEDSFLTDLPEDAVLDTNESGETENQDDRMEEETNTDNSLADLNNQEDNYEDEYIEEIVIMRNEDNENNDVSVNNINQVNPVLSEDIVRYHVQIAASTVPLEETYLREIYSGGKPINNFQEDGWEKYYVETFTRFEDAKYELNNNVDTEDAFIIAFLIGKKVKAYKARIVEKVLTNTTLDRFYETEENQFRIQIAASTRPLSMNELERIYPNTSEIGIIYEEGWFKYSIPGLSTREATWNLIDETNVKGAFVTQYQGTQRLFP